MLSNEKYVTGIVSKFERIQDSIKYNHIYEIYRYQSVCVKIIQYNHTFFDIKIYFVFACILNTNENYFYIFRLTYIENINI